MFNVSMNGMILTVINLIVLYLLLKKFLFKPVTAMIESRQKEVETNLAVAATEREQAQTMLEEYQSKLEEAGQDAANLVAKAKIRADREYQVILTAAQNDAKMVAAEAQIQIESERVAMLSGVRHEVTALAIMAASKVSGREMNSSDDEILVESFLAEVGERT